MNSRPAASSSDSSDSLSTGLLVLLAVAAGVTVANIYYNQPLLEEIGRAFHAGSGATGWMAVATQLGYASGLLLVVPLGDSVDRRRLIIATAFGATAFLVAIAFATNLGLAIAASYPLGLISITPQLIVPLAAGLAPAERRGRVVGFVMSGLLIGILCARVLSGFVGSWLGWRASFGLGAVVTALVGVCLFRLPVTPARSGLSYGQLLRSLPVLLWREPVLRRHSIVGAFGFAAFSVFWTTLGFYLASRPEHYGPSVVGLFGLVAVAGALAAPIAGRLSDRHSARWVNSVSLLVMAAGFVVMAGSGWSLAALVVGVFLMDAGAQANQISNQTRIYTLAPELRNRVTSAYMVTYFIGGAIGSAVGTRAWAVWGWTGVWGTGALLALLALVPLWAGSRPRAGSRPEARE